MRWLSLKINQVQFYVMSTAAALWNYLQFTPMLKSESWKPSSPKSIISKTS
jgi:hypothetical protein